MRVIPYDDNPANIREERIVMHGWLAMKDPHFLKVRERKCSN